jgi:hypothetical protein
LVGNEVNTNLTAGADLCTDWYPQLDSMALAAENAGSAHPVGTAVAGMTDVCRDSCSDDLDLPNVDLWATQLYPGCGFGTAFNAYSVDPNCERPLIVTEVGVDAYARPSAAPGTEDQASQASCLDALVEDANADLTVRPGGLGVLSGLTLFEFTDEWWKSTCGTSWTVQDTCPDWDNFGFPDGKVHEEWFGIAALDAGDPTLRSTRTAYTTMGDKWLGPVCNMRVDAFDSGTGSATVSFNTPAGGAVDTNIHYGPLSAVSSLAYSGSLAGLGTTGLADVTLPAGDLFWVVAAENTVGEEGCYGTDSAGTERPCVSGNCDVDQVSGWNCWCSPTPEGP